jgi:peptidoglycan-associated lipoprotein
MEGLKMNKRMIMIFMVTAFLSGVTLTTISCAKKQLKTDTTSISPESEIAQGEEGIKESESAQGEVSLEDISKDTGKEVSLSDKEMQKIQGEIQAFQSKNIYFDFDKSDIKTEARGTLTEKAKWMETNSTYSLIIEGHCDERGTSEYNLALGERRATAAAKFLEAMGISYERISTISYGEERPADLGHNEDAWANNRRDEFKLSE